VADVTSSSAFPTCGLSIARGCPGHEAVINGLLSRYPLSEDGYVAAAAALFWDNWPSLTALFNKVANFLRSGSPLGNHDPGHLLPLGGRPLPLGQPAFEGL